MRRLVLVPLDGESLAERALTLAVLLAETLGADLDLLRVVAAEEPAVADARAAEYLTRIAETDVHQRLHVSTRTMRGSPAQCIVREASAEHVSMVVMATHARSGVRRAVLGSVAEYVVAHAPAPTVLVRAGTRSQDRLETLLVAIDGSSGAPLDGVIQLARASGARIVLLRVVAPEETCIWQWQRGPVLDEPQTVMAARMQLNDVARRMCEKGIVAEVRVAIGAAAPTINSVASAIHADLIVMSTHARTGAQRAVQGSVTDAVVRTADRPVLVWRLIPPRPGEVKQLDLYHVFQHGVPHPLPLSIPEPLDKVQHAHGTPRWGHLAGKVTR